MVTFLWERGFRDLIWESLGTVIWGRCIVKWSSGWFSSASTGFLRTCLWHSSLPQVFSSLCPVGQKHRLCVKYELLADANWSDLRGAEAMAFSLFFLLTALLLLSVSFKDWEEGESNRFLVSFLHWEWGYHRANLTDLVLVISLENQGLFNCSAVIVACVFVITSFFSVIFCHLSLQWAFSHCPSPTVCVKNSLMCSQGQCWYFFITA